MDCIDEQFDDRDDICVVCKMPAGDNVLSSISTEYQGQIISFCSDRCYKRYLEDPAHYVEFEDDVLE